MNEPIFDRVCVIGLGLVGSSVLRALGSFGGARTRVAFDIDPAVRDRVRALAIAEEVAGSAEEAVKGADLVILAVPVGVCGAVAAEIAPYLEEGAIVTDVGSVKATVAREVSAVLPQHVTFIPGHPIAGTELSGPDAGFATLFHDRWWIFTPLANEDDALDRLRRLVEGFGAKVEVMDCAHHDLVLAITSHVPHLIAYNIVGTAADLEEVTKSEVIKFSAGGFRDFTRIAASDPTMWRDVFLNNREAVLEMLGRFSEDLSRLQRAVRSGDGDGLFDLFTRTRAIRRDIVEAGQETAEPDFGRTHLDFEAEYDPDLEGEGGPI